MDFEKIIGSLDTFKRESLEVEIPGKGGDLRARLYMPKKKGPHQGVLFNQGLLPNYMQNMGTIIPRYLTSLDFVVLCPIYDGHKERRFIRRDAQHAVSAYHYLQGLDDVDAQRTGMMGISYGGLLSLMASEETDPDYVVTLCAPTDLEDMIVSTVTGGEKVHRFAKEVIRESLPRMVPDEIKHLEAHDEENLFFDLYQDHYHFTSIARDWDPSPLTSISGYAREKMEELSPVTRADRMNGRFLLIHGKEDRCIPHSQSVRMHEELQAAGKESELHLVEGLGHVVMARKPATLARGLRRHKDLVKRVVDFVR